MCLNPLLAHKRLRSIAYRHHDRGPSEKESEHDVGFRTVFHSTIPQVLRITGKIIASPHTFCFLNNLETLLQKIMLKAFAQCLWRGWPFPWREDEVGLINNTLVLLPEVLFHRDKGLAKQMQGDASLFTIMHLQCILSCQLYDLMQNVAVFGKLITIRLPNKFFRDHRG